MTSKTETKKPAILAKTIVTEVEHLFDANGKPYEQTRAVGVRFAFDGYEPFTLAFDAVHETIQWMLMANGASQKIGDAAAIARNTETGKPATVADKYAASYAVYERLLAGRWNAIREGGGNAGGILLRALIRYYDGKRTPEQVREWFATLDDATKTALEGNERIAEIVRAIKLEKVDATIDSGALLDGFGADEEGDTDDSAE